MTRSWDPAHGAGALTRRDIGRSAMAGALSAGLAGSTDRAMAATLPAGSAIEGAANLRAFGAYGDGQRDDTIAIRTAVAHCVAAGRNLYIPPGMYSITGSIVVDTAIGFTIFGEGYASCIRPSPNGDYIPILIQSGDFTAITSMHLRNFRIDANGTGQLNTGIITFNDAVGSISQMWLENGTRTAERSGQNGISCSSGKDGGAGPEVIITGNVIRHFSKAGINFTSGGARAVITANFISNIAGNGTAPAIQVNGGRNAIIAHNHITEIEGAGIYIATDKLDHPSFSANISHNIIERCGSSSDSQGDGILIASENTSDSYIVIEGNQIFRNGTRTNGGCGIRIENCDNAVIIGNSCHHNTFDGIRISNSSYIQIAGNRCGDNNIANVEYAGGIQLRGKGRHISITGNHLASKGDTQSYAIIADAAAELSFVTIAGNHLMGNARGTIYWQARGNGLDVEVAVQQRTSGRDPKVILLWRVDPSAACWMTASLTGRQVDVPRSAVYARDVSYRMQGTALVQELLPSSSAIASDHHSWGGVTFSSMRDFAVVRVAGIVDADIEWIGSVRIRSS